MEDILEMTVWASGSVADVEEKTQTTMHRSNLCIVVFVFERLKTNLLSTRLKRQ